MRHIKAARVYRAPLPAKAHLSEALAKLAFQEITAVQAYSCGFVPVAEDELVDADPSGRFMHIKFRLDQKVIPGATLAAEVGKQVLAREEELGHKLGRKGIAEIREQVRQELTARALHRTTVISLFHDRQSEFLIAATSSKGVVDRALDRLIRALGSLKTTTIHIDSLQNGLTARMRTTLFSGECNFAPFSLEGDYWLEGEEEKASLQRATDAVLCEALGNGLRVKALRLRHELVAFNLTSDFIFKNIRFDASEEEEPLEPAAETLAQLVQFTAALDELCRMFEYQPPEDEDDGQGE